MKARLLQLTGAGLAAILSGGCVASGPILDNPVYMRLDPECHVDNPIYVPFGNTPEAYARIFERTIDVLDDYFEISLTNRYDGRIETFPRIAPGYEQFWRVGNPGWRNRTLATLQTNRNRAVVLIQPADGGGYFINVTVFRELEDLPRPTRQTAGAATFFQAPTIERQYEVIDPTIYESSWIPQGRNCELEQLILQRIKKCM
jgi:hypothetical protein